MCGIEKWFVLHFCTNHFVHRNLTKYFSKKLKFFRVAHSNLGAKALSFSSSPHRTGKRWEDIFFSCSQKWTRKNPETVAASGFSGAISFLVAQCGCGGRTWTYDLRVMRQSQGKIGVVSAPICAFYHRSLGGFSIVFVQTCPLFSRSGSKVGQDRFTGGFQCGNVDCSIGVNNSVCCEHLHRNSVVHQTWWCNLLAWGYSWVFFYNL